MDSNQTLKKQGGINILLKKNLSKGQLLGYSIANVVGLTVILAGILFFCDSRHSASHDDKFFSEDYIVVSKTVKGVNLEPVSFSDEEIEEFEKQPWVKKLGRFTSSRFPVNASIDMGGRGMSTYLFFEAVPDEFFDKKPMMWEFNPSKKFVPVVLNKDYLALYNFGFAIPQGLPQLSEDIIGTVPLKLRIPNKDGEYDIFDAAVVGFSSRLNTIAVPQDFIDWANKEYAPGNEATTSRLIIQIDRLDNSSMEQYLKDNSLEIAGDKEADSKVSEFLGVVSGVVAANGLVISLLALFILILSIFLLLQKSRTMLRNLLLLGYSPQQVGRYYEKVVIITNCVITLLAVGFTFLARLIWTKPLEALGLGHANILFMLGAAILYFVIITGINIIIIRRHLILIWQNK